MTEPSPQCIVAGDDPAAHDADHVHEFGDVPQLVHLEPSEKSEEHVIQPILRTAPHAHRQRFHHLGRRLHRPRHLMQYFFSDTLYRTRGIRKVSSEELFLDLVIVASIASLGHELRASEISWATVEKFVLLFAAVHCAWRQAVFLWNLWGVHADLLEKIGIYLTFAALVGIALGAHNAFDDGVRPYVAISSFLATFVPATGNLWWSSSERLLKNPANRINPLQFQGVFTLISITPYFAAAFVSSSEATRYLYWSAFTLQLFALVMPYIIYKTLHRNVTDYTRLAINIELMVEKYEVLTMIVLGETVIGILFEGGAVVGAEGARVGFLYLAALGATAILYSLQTLYIQVDSAIPKGAVHAIRHDGLAGLTWMALHLPFHFFLILLATGLGISVRDIALPAPEISAVFRAEAASGPQVGFATSARWIFSVGWGGSLICSALIGALHIPGPRTATKLYRSIARVVIAIGLMVGMPFTDVTPGLFVGIHAVATVLISLLEFLCVQMDRIGFFKSELSVSSRTDSSGNGITLRNFTDSESDTDSETEGLDLESGDGKLLGETTGRKCQDEYFVALKERLCKGHCKRFIAVKDKRTAAQRENSKRG